MSTMETRLEQADNTASLASTGRQYGLNVGVAALSKRTAKISASSWTRRGRMETVRHWKRRWAYSRFSSSMFHQGSSASPPRRSECRRENSDAACRFGTRPIETYAITLVSVVKLHIMSQNLHAVCASREHINNQLPVLLSPTPHLPV